MSNRKGEFLRDVVVMAFTAFGGPQAHIAMMLDYLVSKKGYLTEKELIELNALCNLLPGPTSTQTITSIGYKLGGPSLAAVTIMIWAFPALVLMTVFSFGYAYFQQNQLSLDFLQFIPPLAVGFVVVAAYKIGKKVVTDSLTLGLLVAAAVVAFFFRQPWVFPLILVVGGMITSLLKRGEGSTSKVNIKPKWSWLALFVGIFLFAELLAFTIKGKPFILFENFYRFGSLVFGGGQVLIPFMQGQLVEKSGYLTNDEFLTGFGLVQGLPGPVFSFSAFAGGMSMSDAGWAGQLLGCFIGAIGIFLPGTILIFFVYPLWEDLKSLSMVRNALSGVNATAAGLVVAAALILFNALELDWLNPAIVVVSAGVLLFTKLPAPVLVVVAVLVGFVVTNA